MNKIILLLAGLILVAGLGVGGAKIISAVRGIRNNNPLNIEHGDDWDGLSPTQTDSRFCQFIDAIYGIRAGARILKNYAKGGVNTVAEIISTWAPPSENNTEAYIKAVCTRSGLKRDQVITRSEYLPLLKAMIVQENGVNPYSDATISRGISLA